MYNLESTLQERFGSRIQTKANNNDPRPLVYITRNRTAITSQRYWEKQMITDTVGTRSSTAVRRPEGSFLGDMIFTAQVENGTAMIRYAAPRNNIADMVWTELATITNISELSIMFDGIMKIHEDKVEAYTVGELPVMFFVDTSGSLKMRNMDDVESVDITISDDAVNVASVRGLYSEAANVNDGIWCFYTNSEGELWEARIVDYEVAELNQITMLPTGVTSWIDVWVGTTFDYRIVLQLKGDDGKVYTLISKSRPSGYSFLEYVRLSKIKISGVIGLTQPTLLSIDNVEV